eukprot:gnl/MRDRNA2_/MRDRNA2_111548_c0_seq1.p1 gnl/MRDRNA2_/MRDRNA2_111548_c0~~gnl/MRDRNA2_/MRDRNA2_111548_c0_seq1.p1  ORF type:complete len:332 (+),score=52.59 gnl/MRDRNA2_/MRDRNA2_111548_c0_seq1:86-1081(+)
MSHSFRKGSLQGIQPLQTELFPDELVDAYLERLGIERPAVANLEALNSILAAHVDRVAYENIDIQLAKPLPVLTPRASAERVALQKRGGYCFLIVDAFSGLLRSLGFTVSLHTGCCVYLQVDPPPLERWGDHMVALVHLDDGIYCADVGLGEGPRSAFPLREHTWEEDGFTFSLEERPNEGSWYFINPANVTGTVGGFWVDTSTSVSGSSEFQAFHEHYWLNRQTAYSTGPIFCHRKTTGRGVLSLFGCTLRRSHPEFGEKKYEILATATSKDEWFALVKDNFHLPLDDLSSEERDAVWARVSASDTAWRASKKTSPDTAAWRETDAAIAA